MGKKNGKKFDPGGVKSLQGRLKRLGFDNYQAYLKSDHWRERKKQWFYSKCFKGLECSVITCKEVYGLDLHHRHYFNLGAEQNGDLVLVCHAHHTKIHDIEALGVKLTKATNMVLDDKVIEF